MTDAPDQVGRWRGSDVARWSLCAVTILAVHAGAAAYIVMRDPGPPPGGLPAVAVMEMLPEVSAPTSPSTDVPPGPEMQKIEDPLEKLAEKSDDEETATEALKQPEPEPEAPLAAKPEVAVAPPREPEPPVEAKPVEKKPIETPKRPVSKKKPAKKPTPTTTAPPPSQTARAQSAPPAIAPPVPSNAMPAWNQTIAAMLKRNLRFPADAERRGARGSARVRISISRDGNLISASLVSGTGDSQLDQEAVAVARRTAPFPPPPDGRPAMRVVPINFTGR